MYGVLVWPLRLTMIATLSVASVHRLESLGMGQHAALFHKAEVDMAILPFMREADCAVSWSCKSSFVLLPSSLQLRALRQAVLTQM